MPQGMEPDVRKYLVKILHSLCYGMLWLAVNVLAGLYWGYGIVDKKLAMQNVIFYLWFLASLGALLYYYYRSWRK